MIDKHAHSHTCQNTHGYVYADNNTQHDEDYLDFIFCFMISHIHYHISPCMLFYIHIKILMEGGDRGHHESRREN